MQCYIEIAYADQTSMSGCLVDIIKAFNHLPRIPILRAAKHLGLPRPVIRAWSSALMTLERRFAIRGSVGPPLKSSTGLAEGCAMSVVGMAVINIMVSDWMQRKQPETRVWSFVDNWELTTKFAHQTVESFQNLQQITELLDLQLDPQKTVIWATGAQCRKWLREQGHDVSMWAKDLGAHVQYSRQVTNSSIQTKISKFLERWGDFSRSPATYSQKIKAIKAVCWPNTLHGISSVHLGRDHFDSLRTAAMRSLHETSWGASPILHLSLVEQPMLDPGFHALMTTVMDCRNHLTFDTASVLLDSIISEAPRIKPLPGPCNVLLHRLQLIDWYWEIGVGFHDEWNRHIDIWDLPIQEVKSRLTESWQHSVSCEVAKRHTFGGMQHTSAYLTRAFDKPPPAKEAILRRALNGTFYTADKLQHGDGDTVDNTCIFCGQIDSFRHRNWECPALESVRSVCSHEDKACILSHPPSFYNHGWVPMPESLHSFRDKLLETPDQTFSYCEPQWLPECLELFTDGGALNPKNALSRWATWGVVLAVTDQAAEFQAISSGVVRGLLQTVSCAELTAAISAVYFAASRGKKFRLWIDNAYVVKACNKCLRHKRKWIGRKIANHDLLQALYNAFQYGDGLCVGIIKVSSHQQSGTESAITQWVFRGNEAADRLAASVFSQHPELLAVWTDLHNETQRLLELRRVVHTVLITVGEAAIEMTKANRASKNSEQISADLQSDNIEFTDWRLVEFLPQTAKSFRVDEWVLIYKWIGTFHETGMVQRWSWYQLYMDFLLDHKQGGPWYASSKKRWANARERPEADFAQQSRWFAKYVTKLARNLDMPLPTIVSRPDSYTIFFWCTTLPVRINEARRARVDSALALGRATYRRPCDMVDAIIPGC